MCPVWKSASSAPHGRTHVQCFYWLKGATSNTAAGVAEEIADKVRFETDRTSDVNREWIALFLGPLAYRRWCSQSSAAAALD